MHMLQKEEQIHRIIEYFKLKGAHKGHQVQLLGPPSSTEKLNPVSESVIEILIEFRELGVLPTARGSLYIYICMYWCVCSALRYCIPELTAIGRVLTVAAMQWIGRIGEGKHFVAFTPCMQYLGKETALPG